jgi:hypothetical protein
MQLIGAFPAKAAAQHDQELFEVGIERGIDALLNAEFDAHRHGAGGFDHVDTALDLFERNVRGCSPLFDGDAQQRLPDVGISGGVLREK